MHGDAHLIETAIDYTETSLTKSIDSLMQDLPGAVKALAEAKTVLIKPNLGGGPAKAMTSPEMIVAFSRWVAANFDCTITVGDSSVVGSHAETVIVQMGLREALSPYGVTVIDLAESDAVTLKAPQEGMLKTIEVFRPAVEAELVVSLAKLKTNYATKVSLSIKNLKGIISGREKIRFHRLGVHECLAELLATVGHPLGLIDAVEGWDVERSLPVGALVGGQDAVAVDWLGALLTRTDPEGVTYLRLCRDLGIGGMPTEEQLARAQRMSKPFDGPVASVAGMNLPAGIAAVEGDACSGCISILQRVLKRMEVEGTLAGLPPLTVAMGPKAALDQGATSEGRLLIAMGNCCGLRRVADHVIDGCPPQSRFHVQDFLEKLRSGQGG